jgi:hypothetical protein
MDPMLYLILFSACFGFLLYFIAAKRKADKPFWLAMGILFGPFALPLVFIAKTIDSNSTPSEK